MIPCLVKYTDQSWHSGYYYLQSLLDAEDGSVCAVVVDAKGFLYHRDLNTVQLDMSYLDDDEEEF